METTLAFAAATWAIAMALGPLLQIRSMVRHGESRTISVGYFVVLWVGFVLWTAYGVAADNYALIIPNSVALIICSATICVALWLRRASPPRPPSTAGIAPPRS